MVSHNLALPTLNRSQEQTLLQKLESKGMLSNSRAPQWPAVSQMPQWPPVPHRAQPPPVRRFESRVGTAPGREHSGPNSAFSTPLVMRTHHKVTELTLQVHPAVHGSTPPRR